MKKYLLSGANVFEKGKFVKKDILVSKGKIADISVSIPPMPDVIVFNFNNLFIFPGLIDVHVHLREPGFFYKESIETGTLAAAHGGFTSVCAMPNLNPPPDSLENLRQQQQIINQTAAVNVYPYGTITKQQKGLELSDLEQLADKVIAFSDDGYGVQNESLMKSAMLIAKRNNKIIAAHCEDTSLLDGGYIHQGDYARLHSHKGISSQSEYLQIQRDLQLVQQTNCRYHVCHISTKESVNLIRQAKQQGLNVTCETAPHYLTLCEMDLKEDGRFKMNPPLRSNDDKSALIEGIKDGTIDMIATDHAPHSFDEKSKGLRDSLMGVVGLETAFSVLYTKLVRNNVIPLEKLIALMQVNPSKCFNIGNSIEIGQSADLTVFDLNDEYIINTEDFLSKGKSTPFDGEKVFGRCKLTIVKGSVKWQQNMIEK